MRTSASNACACMRVRACGQAVSVGARALLRAWCPPTPPPPPPPPQCVRARAGGALSESLWRYTAPRRRSRPAGPAPATTPAPHRACACVCVFARARRVCVVGACQVLAGCATDMLRAAPLRPRPLHPPASPHPPDPPESVPKIHKALKTSLQLNQYSKSGSTFSLSEQVAAPSDCS